MILLLSLLISFGASAKTYLVPCNGDNTKVCQIKTSQSPGNALCQRPDSEFDGDGSVYDVQIVEVPEGFFGNLMDLIGLGNSRPWAPGEVVADNEQIVCTIDSVKVQAKADARAAAEAAEQDRQTARQQRKDRAKTICQSQPDASPLKALCEAVFDEDL